MKKGKTFSWGLIELGSVFIVFLAAFFFYNHYQPHISFESEPLLDAHQYLKSYLYFKGVLSEYDVAFPFNTRIGVPFLAALLPLENSILSFKVIHFLLISVAIIFFHSAWQRLKVPRILRFGFWFWLLFHWLGPVRYVMHEPIMVDTACYFFYSVFIWCFIEKKTHHFYWLVPLSVLFKESLLPYVFVLTLFCFIVLKEKKETKQFLLAFLLGMATLYGVQLLFPMNVYSWKYQAPITVLWYLKNLLLSPFDNLRWIAALLISMGLLVVLYPYQKKHLKTPEFYLMLTSVFLGFSSGVDYSRIFFIGFPFVALFYFKNGFTRKLGLFCILCSIPFMHLFSVIPNLTDKEIYISWHPEYSEWKQITAIFLYVFACYLLWKVINRLAIIPPKWIRKRL